MTPEQCREVQTWDAETRMAFDELAACLEFEQGLSRDAAELQALTVTRQTAQKLAHMPYVNREALPPKQPRYGKERPPARASSCFPPYRVVHPRIVPAKPL